MSGTAWLFSSFLLFFFIKLGVSFVFVLFCFFNLRRAPRAAHLSVILICQISLDSWNRKLDLKGERICLCVFCVCGSREMWLWHGWILWLETAPFELEQSLHDKCQSQYGKISVTSWRSWNLPDFSKVRYSHLFLVIPLSLIPSLLYSLSGQYVVMRSLWPLSRLQYVQIYTADAVY